MAQQSICISPVYRIFDALGTLTDYIVTKGDLSPENQALFEQIANNLGITDREIKAKDSGLIIRLFAGYHNALAHQLTNRIYLNNSELNTLSPNERKFLIAHELTHHKNHDYFKAWFVRSFFNYLVAHILLKSPCLNRNDNYFHRYLLDGWLIPGLVQFNIWSLLFAQYKQSQKRAADANTLACTDIEFDDAVRAINYLHYPDTKNWPLYGKIGEFLNYYTREYFYTLPIVKEHTPHIASFNDRIKALKNSKQSSPFIFKTPALTVI